MSSIKSEFSAIARQVGLPPELIEYCYEAGLVQHPPADRDLAELRRARRLQHLEVNLAGIEIILRMRQRVLTLQAEMERMAAEMHQVQAQFEREMQEIRRQLARDV